MNSFIELQDVAKEYPLGKLSVMAVRGVDLQIEKGDFISITGPSGSGKTTILNLLGCLDIPTRGKVLINGLSTDKLNDDSLSELRQEKIGFIFQSFNLVPVLNVYENIEFPLFFSKKKKTREQSQWIEFLIEQVGLSKRKQHRPNELSGGQRQRVAIARALVAKPEIILADEPTANLDSKTGMEIIELMKRINEDNHTTFIFSTHDSSITQIADHKISLSDGVISGEERK